MLTLMVREVLGKATLFSVPGLMNLLAVSIYQLLMVVMVLLLTVMFMMLQVVL